MNLFIPAFMCLLLLILHSYVFRGKGITLFFFGSCYVIHVLKGLVDARNLDWDYLPLMNFLKLTYKGIPYGSYLFGIPIGWVFAQYISWCIAEGILRNTSRKRGSFFPTIALSILGTGLIGVCIEKVNEGMNWWQWAPDERVNFSVYFMVWALWSILFYYFFFISYIKGPNKWVLRVGAFTFLILFTFVLYRAALTFEAVTRLVLVLVLVVFSHIFLYFVDSIKLKPMLRRDMKAYEAGQSKL